MRAMVSAGYPSRVRSMLSRWRKYWSNSPRSVSRVFCIVCLSCVPICFIPCIVSKFVFLCVRDIVSGMREIVPEKKNPALREMAREIPVADITGTRVQNLITDMKSLLSKEDYGVALAARRVGEPIRLFIVSGKALARGSRNAPDEDEDETEETPQREESPPPPDQVYINPEILKMSRGSKDKHEGCLSIRGYWGMVPRAEKATIRAYDEHGKAFSR